MSSIDEQQGSMVDAVFRQLREMVIEEYAPGDQLPAEAVLADRFNVSRLTVREALKALSGRGLVTIRRGTRPVVRAQESHLLVDYFDVEIRRDPRRLLELLEIRRALEELSAVQAARSADESAIAALMSAVDQMDAARHDEPAEGMQRYHDADVAFHAALAAASGNTLLRKVVEGLSPSLRESFRISTRGHLSRGGTLEDGVRAHRAIADAVARGDARGARAAIAAHLDDAEKDLLAASVAASTAQERDQQ